jgi:alkanesulfonate monooxygenase SsuD/methylene tetrahydromethanopterin reductase-like flavin-dependent oxidoreductase (luciferase family)
MRLGINLPQYAIDFADPADAVATVMGLARVAEERGVDDVWVSDHPFVVGPDGAVRGALESLVMLGALSRATDRIGLGTLVLASTMRAPALVGHIARTLPASRLTIGAGGGWYKPEHDAFGLRLPSLDERMERLEETLEHARGAGARTLAGGIGVEALAIAARTADVWNAAWDPPPEAFRSMSAKLDEACPAAGRRTAEVARSVGVNLLLARDEAGLERAVEKLRIRAPFLETVTVRTLRERIVCGTPEECAGRIAAYGADEVVVTLALRDDAAMLTLFADEVAPKLR